MGWRARLLGQVEDEVRPSIEKRVEAGTVLFRAGEPAHSGALILEGEVELLAGPDEGGGRIATRGRGAYVGDDAILGDGVWRHTARVSRRCRLEMLPRAILVERLAGRPADGRNESAAVYAVKLIPETAESAALLPATGRVIVDFPFVIGRVATEQAEPGTRNTLLFDEGRPHRLSRRQCTILRTAEGAAIVDSGSRFGTFVAGQRVDAQPVPLPSGEPVDLVLGGPQSPYRFRLLAD